MAGLKAIFPEIFCENQIDFAKLKAILGESNLAPANERYTLDWAGKASAYRVLQEPTTNTLIPCRKESVDFDDTHNLFIEAENLEALKILQKAYAGCVKMIYIDPPYNTGNDSFIYPDKFSETREEYARRVGDTDDKGYLKRDGVFQGAFRKNAKDNGHYHSNWLNMMLPRLHLAKTLLSDDGVIFISIDDNEQAQLKLLCDEVFGEENCFAEMVVIRAEGGGLAKKVVKGHDYLFIYTKNSDLFKGIYKPKDIRGKKVIKDDIEYWIEEDWLRKEFGKYGTCLYEEIEEIKGIDKKKEIDDGLQNGEYVLIKKEMGHIVGRLRKVSEDGTKFYSILKHLNKNGTEDLESINLNNIFSFPKPVSLVREIVLGTTIFTKNNSEIILDFFSGSGTTAHAVMQLNAEDGGNRRYICVQLPEETDEKSEAAKAGFATIAEIAKERIRRAGARIKAENPNQNIDTGFKVFKLAQSHFKQWKTHLTNKEIATPATQARNDRLNSGSLNGTQQLDLLSDFQDVVQNGATLENMAYEIALRLGFQLTDAFDFSGSIVWLDNHQKTRKTALLLKQYHQDLLDEILPAKPVKVFALDKIFNGDDALKVNTALQLQDANIDFETL
ncbi:MAG: site-specific DNA-methyltransferase [Neisseriaceae bacterium]|nr:site-specific DNA-methyltransferase [Neisseriaceae bacterium]